jgi:hypothetical protein
VKDNILSQLKTKFQNLGFSAKAFEGVAEYLAATVTEESQIETAISGVEPLLKAFQGDIDSRVTTAVKKRETELKAQQAATQQQQQQSTQAAQQQQQAQQANTADEVPAWAKTMMQKLEAFEKKETQSQLLAKLKAKIADKVPESYLRGRQISIETEDQIDALAQTLEADFSAFKQDLINQGILAESPKNATQSVKAGEAYAAEAAALRNKRGSVDNPVPGLLDGI